MYQLHATLQIPGIFRSWCVFTVVCLVFQTPALPVSRSPGPTSAGHVCSTWNCTQLNDKPLGPERFVCFSCIGDCQSCGVCLLHAQPFTQGRKKTLDSKFLCWSLWRISTAPNQFKSRYSTRGLLQRPFAAVNGPITPFQFGLLPLDLLAHSVHVPVLLLPGFLLHSIHNMSFQQQTLHHTAPSPKRPTCHSSCSHPQHNGAYTGHWC